MRLYPAGHTLARRARESTVLAGHRIPAKRIVAVSVWAIHHNPAVWPDPYRFDPSRFDAADATEGSGERERHTARYAHLPFGGGPRGCIGQYLAMAEMTVAIATIVRAFKLESLTDKPQLDVGVSLLPLGSLPCRLSPCGPVNG
jgi:cytochrome P450